MYPNPQDALPLPPRPDLAQYKKRAKELADAARTGGAEAIGTWAGRWIAKLAELRGGEPNPSVERSALQVTHFACAKLLPAGRLADAQFVIARAHGFTSWPKLAAHVRELQNARSGVGAFEQAADAIVAGDASTLERLLRENPGLVRARSTREHDATLLHYVSANGVEGYRQRSPKNAARVAELLLAAGAEVDAEADVYGSGCTALGLVATSGPPHVAGVQRDVMDVLLRHGARFERPGLAGSNSTLVRACLMNGQPEAARYLASRGAPLDLAGAAGIGRVDELARYVDDAGNPSGGASREQIADAFWLACGYGQTQAVAFLLERGVPADLWLHGQGEGHTGLHAAAFFARPEVAALLLRHGAKLDVTDATWGTPPLRWALAGWGMREPDEPGAYHEVVRLLVAAGAAVTPRDVELVGADPEMLAALRARERP